MDKQVVCTFKTAVSAVGARLAGMSDSSEPEAEAALSSSNALLEEENILTTLQRPCEIT